MEYRQKTFVRYPPEKLSRKFLKIPKKISWKKSCLNNTEDSRPETLVKRSLNNNVFLQILRIYQECFPTNS